VKDKDGLKRKAMELAVNAAKENAVAIAKTAGISLGKLRQVDYGWAEVRFSNNELNLICEDNKSDEKMDYNFDFEPVSVYVRESVTLFYEIED